MPASNTRRSGRSLNRLRALVSLWACAMAWLGAPTTTVAAAPYGWHFSRPDTAGDIGEYASVALDAKGRPRIAYFDFDHFDLRYAERDSGRWKISVVDTADALYNDISLALDSQGRPHIAYYNTTKLQLQYAMRSPGGWIKEIVDNTVDAGGYLSLALDPDDVPSIAYYDNTNLDLRYARRYSFGYWYVETVDATGSTGSHVSLAFDGYYPHIAYRNFTSGDLKHAMWQGAWYLETVEAPNNVGYYSAIAVDNLHQIHIAYYDNTLRRLRYAAGSYGSWTLSTIDPGPGAGRFVSLALHNGTHAHVAYTVEPAVLQADLMFATESGGAWTRALVDTTGDVGYFPSIVTGPGERPRIAYYDNTDFDLRYAEWLPQGLHLNEFVVRPPTGRKEFFELLNASPDTVDFGRSQIMVQSWNGDSIHDHFLPPDVVRPPDTFLVDSMLTGQEGNFFFDDGAVVSLLDSCGSELDRVGYGVAGGAPISCPLFTPPGGSRPPGFQPGRLRLDAAQVPLAPGDTSETSTSLVPDSDSGVDADDYSLGSATPGTTNVVAAPDLGNSVRLNGAYVFPHNDDVDPVNESFQFENPLGEVVDAGGDYVSDGFLLRPLFPPGTQLPLEPGQKYLVVQGLNGEFALELDEEDRLDLYESRPDGLVRVDQLGWMQIPTYFPDSAVVRSPDGTGPSGGWDWDTSGGGVNLFYSSPDPFAPPGIPTGAEPLARVSRLHAPAPNPARGGVSFAFDVAGLAGSTAAVEVALYDARGRRVARPISGLYEAGPHRVLWSPSAGGGVLRAGVYWMRLSVGGRPTGGAERLVWLAP